MIKTEIEINFQKLYDTLMAFNFLQDRKLPPEVKSRAALTKSVTGGDKLLPAPFRLGYVQPLLAHLGAVFAQRGIDANILETLGGAVYQHVQRGGAGRAADERQSLNRFLAVISNLYRSFLAASKRAALDLPLRQTLPPLAVFQSVTDMGPFTIPCDQIAQMTGGDIGVVSMPYTFADHPLLYGSLAHETGGHDVLHADETLLPQLRQEVYSLFAGPEAQSLGILWDYWMDEAASDVYGVLNMGPSFGYNLAMLLGVFIAQGEAKANGTKPAAAPALRSESGTDETGSALDEHPTDILRLSLIQGVVESLVGLSPSTRAAYVERLARLGQHLGGGATTIELTGLARVTNGLSVSFQDALPLAAMQVAARRVGAMIATTPLAALDGHSIQEIETWDDADENTAMTIAGRLQSNSSVVGAGDDAALIAGLTLATIREPDPKRYEAMSQLVRDALDDSFNSDPYWGKLDPGRFITRFTRTLTKNPEVPVDPYVEEIIDYNPLEEDAALTIAGLGVATVTHHAINQIPWPGGTAPELDDSFTFKGPDAELPKAEFVIFTWTSAEANAMAAVMTPGIWAMPASKSTAPAWHEYTNQWDAKFAGRSFGRAPAAANHYIGKYMPILIDGRKVLLFKSNFHLARDDKSMPVKDMFKQVIQQTGAKLVLTSGTAGAIGPKLKLGDVVATNRAYFHCGRAFKSAPFNLKEYKSSYVPKSTGRIAAVNSTMVQPNAASLNAERHGGGTPTIYTPDTANKIGQLPVIVTTDEFEFDDKTHKFGIGKLGAMVEMDDAVLGLACTELGGATDWVAIRNASDEQMASASKPDSDAAANIYKQYGYWTSIPSTLASWAIVLDY
jgi:nucleoside phosphorylase